MTEPKVKKSTIVASEALKSFLADEIEKLLRLGWVTIDEHGGARTQRMIVPGGWIVKHVCMEGLSLVFVPDPGRKWLLQEAIAQGRYPFDDPKRKDT